MKYLIIGNGIAGVSAAEAIREMDREGEILMVSDETELPYSRPMITYLLEGSCTSGQLPIRSSDFYSNLNITPVLGCRVSSMDTASKSVTLRDGRTFSYDRLLIASGADPRTVRAEGNQLQNIFYMRTSAHAKAQLAALPNVRSAVVLGGGLVGFKSAYALNRRGVKVTMIITSPYPLSMQVDEIAGKMLLKEMLEHGFDIRVGASVAAFESEKGEKEEDGANSSKSVKSVLLDTGERIECDLVIVGKGVLPAHTYVPKDRIKIDLGILVNSRMESSAPDVYAAGDVAECTDIIRETPWVNAIWPEAAIQGRIAGQNMAGRAVEHKGSLSRNVMRVFGLDVMTIGYANADLKEDTNINGSSSGDTPEEAPHGCPADSWWSGRYGNISTCRGSGNESDLLAYRIYDGTCGYYRSLIFKGERMAGAVLINNIEQGGVIRSLIENRVPINVHPEEMLSRSFNFAKLLR